MPTQLFREYEKLLKRFGDPGPWPWFCAKGASASGGGRDRPHTPEEIAIGAILTQNTNWKNVEKALANLRRDKSCALRPLSCLTPAKLRRLIRPSGFYNQKAVRLSAFARNILQYGRRVASPRRALESFLNRPTDIVRRDLLAMNGIGKETADTILLYAGNHQIFIVDAYTRRFVQAKNLFPSPVRAKPVLSEAEGRYLAHPMDYDALQSYFMKHLTSDLRLFRDFHALIVQWGKSQARNTRN